MSSCHFWIQTCVQVAGVVATLLLGVLAIWGESLRARFTGPRLTVRLFKSEGELITIATGSPARYYHLRVVNTRPSALATNVRVVLTKVARPAADGQMRWEPLTGPVPFRWQHAEMLPENITIGPPLNADLGFLVQSSTAFPLSLPLAPNNLNALVRKGETLGVEVQALSDQTMSKPLRVSISWDGNWSDDSIQMTKHLVVTEM